MALRRYHPLVAVRRMLVLALFVLLLLPVLASGATPSGGVRGSGVQGTGVQGTGVQGTVKQAAGGACLADDPCDGIGRNIGLVFSRAGQPAHRVHVNDSGGFRMLLAPGRYRVRAVVEPERPVSPSHVTVPLAGFVRVTLVVGSAGHRMSTPGR